MGDYFLDSSALVKGYVQETGSAYVSNLLDPAVPDDVLATRLAGAEVVATLTRRHRNHDISDGDYASALQAFYSDWSSTIVQIELTPIVGERALAFAQRYALKGADAIQLASAWATHQVRLQLQLPTLTFVCADVNLNAAAQAEGLAVHDPNA